MRHSIQARVSFASQRGSLMSRYITAGILTLAVFVPQSYAFALTCTPPEIKICNGSICNCWGVTTYVGPDGKSVIELKGNPAQAPNVLKRLGINPNILKPN
jgi:hypothetical protein